MIFADGKTFKTNNCQPKANTARPRAISSPQSSARLRRWAPMRFGAPEAFKEMTVSILLWYLIIHSTHMYRSVQYPIGKHEKNMCQLVGTVTVSSITL